MHSSADHDGPAHTPYQYDKHSPIGNSRLVILFYLVRIEFRNEIEKKIASWKYLVCSFLQGIELLRICRL